MNHKMKNLASALLISFGWLAAAAQSHAAPVTYNISENWQQASGSGTMTFDSATDSMTISETVTDALGSWHVNTVRYLGSINYAGNTEYQFYVSVNPNTAGTYLYFTDINGSIVLQNNVQQNGPNPDGWYDWSSNYVDYQAGNLYDSALTSYSITTAANHVPEPSVILLLASGLLGFTASRGKKLQA